MRLRGARVVVSTRQPRADRFFTSASKCRRAVVSAGYLLLTPMLFHVGCARSATRDFGGFGESRTETIRIGAKEYVVPQEIDIGIEGFLSAKEGREFMRALGEHGIGYNIGYGAAGFLVSLRMSDFGYAKSLIESIEARRRK
jgi:hypothetical protein